MSLSARRAWIEIQKQGETIFDNLSLSARRAWIEILIVISQASHDCVALRKESVDRNRFLSDLRPMYRRSLSARRAWIEMRRISMLCRCVSVALRKESVDRNFSLQAIVYAHSVALRKESVDRNTGRHSSRRFAYMSLSARRAWIEIPCARFKPIVKSSGRSPQGERG